MLVFVYESLTIIKTLKIFTRSDIILYEDIYMYIQYKGGITVQLQGRHDSTIVYIILLSTLVLCIHFTF